MTNIEFFKLQAKNLFSDYKSRMYNDSDGTYDYFPRFFTDINDIIFNFEIDEEDPFTLMNAQHVIARLAGFYKWTELIKASEPGLELGKLLLTNRIDYLKNVPIITNDESMIVEDWKFFLAENDLQDCDDETKLNIFKDYFLQQDKIIKQLRKEKISIDFSNDAKAQDMLVAIMKEKNLTPEKAILSSITQKIFVRIIETRQGVKISAPEEIAFRYGWITKKQLIESAEKYDKSPYGLHLKTVAEGKIVSVLNM